MPRTQLTFQASLLRLAGGFAAALLFVALPQIAFAANCTAAERTEADKQLWLSPADKAAATKQVFPWGEPKATGPVTHERTLVQRDYVIDYDDDLLGPVWSADTLGLKPLKGGRTDCFRADIRLPSAIASAPSDFDEPIFDQGHMVPNGDMTFDNTAILNTFMMSNMSPQFCQFNRGIWQMLESAVRAWSDGKVLYVINGAVFDRDGDGVRDPDNTAVRMKSRNGKARVAVPTAYYKIIAFKAPDGTLQTLTILLPHDQADVKGPDAVAVLNSHVTTIQAVEQLTGLKFFPSFSGTRTEAGTVWDLGTTKLKTLVAAPCLKTNGAMLTADQPPVYTLP